MSFCLLCKAPLNGYAPVDTIQKSPMEQDVTGNEENPTATSGTPPLDLVSLPEKSLDVDVLATFKCPFGNKRNNQPRVRCPFAGCLFGHQEPTDGGVLQVIPWFWCLDRLLNRCTATTVLRLSESLVRCPYGFHVSVDDLIDRETFSRKMARAVLTGKTAASLPGTVWPTISCFNCHHALVPSTSSYCGLLENCSCVLCKNCAQVLNRTLANSPTAHLIFCPCTRARQHRAYSTRFLLWPTWHVSSSYRQYLFHTIKNNFGLAVSSATDTFIEHLPERHQLQITLNTTELLLPEDALSNIT